MTLAIPSTVSNDHEKSVRTFTGIKATIAVGKIVYSTMRTGKGKMDSGYTLNVIRVSHSRLETFSPPTIQKDKEKKTRLTLKATTPARIITRGSSSHPLAGTSPDSQISISPENISPHAEGSLLEVSTNNIGDCGRSNNAFRPLSRTNSGIFVNPPKIPKQRPNTVAVMPKRSIVL